MFVVHYSHSDRNGNALWVCQCDCGTRKTVLRSSLLRGATQSCGCLNKEAVSKRQTTHGASGGSDYAAWYAMLERCSNQKHHKWPRYGGRGISVCERWKDFGAFLEDMGPRPKGTTIDRENNDGNYEPGNCRWATPKAQANNRSNNRRLVVAGESLTLSDACDRYDINISTARYRLRAGWSMDRVFQVSPQAV